jgi:hypothetical protein
MRVPDAHQALWRRVAAAAADVGAAPDLYVWRLTPGGSRLASTPYFHGPAELPFLGREYVECRASAGLACLSHAYLLGRAKRCARRGPNDPDILSVLRYGNRGGLSPDDPNVVWRWSVLRRIADRSDNHSVVKAKCAAAANELRPAAMWRLWTDRDVYRRLDWWADETDELYAATASAWAATMRPGVTSLG